jgi:hypothetical protein
MISSLHVYACLSLNERIHCVLAAFTQRSG